MPKILLCFKPKKNNWNFIILDKQKQQKKPSQKNVVDLVQKQIQKKNSKSQNPKRQKL